MTINNLEVPDLSNLITKLIKVKTVVFKKVVKQGQLNLTKRIEIIFLD